MQRRAVQYIYSTQPKNLENTAFKKHHLTGTGCADQRVIKMPNAKRKEKAATQATPVFPAERHCSKKH